MSKLIKDIDLDEMVITDCFGNKIDVSQHYLNYLKKLKDEMVVDKIEKTFEIK